MKIDSVASSSPRSLYTHFLTTEWTVLVSSLLSPYLEYDACNASHHLFICNPSSI